MSRRHRKDHDHHTENWNSKAKPLDTPLHQPWIRRQEKRNLWSPRKPRDSADLESPSAHTQNLPLPLQRPEWRRMRAIGGGRTLAQLQPRQKNYTRQQSNQSKGREEKKEIGTGAKKATNRRSPDLKTGEAALWRERENEKRANPRLFTVYYLYLFIYIILVENPHACSVIHYIFKKKK